MARNDGKTQTDTVIQSINSTMYSKTLTFFAAAVCFAAATPTHDSHSVHSHSVVHPVHVHEHHDDHHSEHHFDHHAPGVSSQSVFIHHSDGGHDGGHGDSGHHGHEEEHHGHAKYEFEYKVEDPHTGDNKFQKESRDGDKVEGTYHLVESDGRIRTVKYHADKHNGFNAEVIHSGHAIHPHHHHH